MGRTGARGLATLAAFAALSGASGCGTDVAQTALVMGTPAPVPLDCTLPAMPTELPTDAHLGANVTVMPWDLATGDYVGGAGPGITVAALDSFRLFANGHLLAESTDALVPTFVPLTLLPGPNGIAVVVTAEGRPPALVAELDELERAYGTDAGWKVSSTPETGYGDSVFDDSAWTAAVDRGAIGDNPGCDPGPGFPTGSAAHLITATEPGTAVFRLDVPIVPIGLAAGTTGGANSDPVLATTEKELEDALGSDDAKVVLVPESTIDGTKTGSDVRSVDACPTACPAGSDVAETMNLLTSDETCDVATVPAARTERRISVGSNTTLVGLGRGAALKGMTLDLADSKNVIIRNVAVFDVNPDLIEAGDGISIDGADGVWIDHATFRWISDGFIDCTSGSKNLTFSWLRNEGDNAAACFGNHPRSNELMDTTATIHHTLWRNVNGRAPLASHASSRLHLFNDVITDDIDYAIGAACGAQVLVEGTAFERVLYPTAKFSALDRVGAEAMPCSESSDVGLIDAVAGSNFYGDDVGHHQTDHVDTSEPADAVAVKPTYAYTVDDAADNRFVVETWAGAGARWALPLVE